MYEWDNTPYHSPEKFGLRMIGEFDFSEPDYSFDICVVWIDERGQYWMGTDSGCSCPSPFEDIHDINSLDGPYTKDGLRKRLEFVVAARAVEGESYYGKSLAELKKSVSDLFARM